MAVFRVEHTRNYTVMSNHHLRDKNLSLKAKGLLSQMLSLPEDWDYTLAGLARINCEGKDAIRAAVVELENAGYVQRSQTTDKVGKFGANEYIIRECPVKREPLSAQPLPENPPPDSTLPESPAQSNKDPLTKEKQNKDLRSNDSLPSGPPAPSGPSRAAQPPEEKEGKRRRKRAASEERMEDCRAMIRENIDYDGFVRDCPWNAGQLDEMVELMVEAVCSNRETLRISGSDFPQAAVKSRLLKLDGEHIRFVFDCLRENTTQVRNMKQYLLAVLYNAPVTMENRYAMQVNHDLYGSDTFSDKKKYQKEL